MYTIDTYIIIMTQEVTTWTAISDLVSRSTTCPLNVKFGTNLKGLSQMDFALAGRIHAYSIVCLSSYK